MKRTAFQQTKKAAICANLKRNWYFPVSAMAFFCLNAKANLVDLAGLMIVFLTMIIVAVRIPSIWERSKTPHIILKLFSLATAAGICMFGQAFFYAGRSDSSLIQALEARLPIEIDIIRVVSIIGAIAALFFVYFCVLMLWDSIVRITSEYGTFTGIKVSEWVIYGVLLAALLGFMAFVFAQSQAFYGTELNFNIIYTSDSPTLVRGQVYRALRHSENDLRQPLFAVFAAPFTGIAYLVADMIGASAGVQAMLVNGVQLIMLFAANLMLARMMKLDSLKRVCFMLLIVCTYMQLLFMLMMEQYIVAYFWLVFCAYLIVEKKKPDPIVLWGAGGTMLTSLVLMPFTSDKSPVKDFKAWLMDMLKSGFGFIALMLAFFRFDVIYKLVSRIVFLSRFTGKTVAFTERLYQYIGFISDCFVAPDAGAITTAKNYAAWRLNPIDGVNLVGVLIIVLAVISAVWNRNKKSSLLAAGWIGFSVFMLLGFGWGTNENGLTLYTLYFGWAFLVLLFQLIEKIENKLNIRCLLPIITISMVVVLLVVNIPAMIEMVNFAIAHYPA